MPRRLIVEIAGDSKSLERAFAKASRSAKGWSSTVSKSAKISGLAAGAAGLGAVAAALKVGIGEFSESAKVAAQTSAVLKSTGGAAGVTAKHINALAEALRRKTGIDDEQVASTENLLLTFGKISAKGGVFDDATKTALDLSVAFKTDLKSSTVLVGKALQDPIKGISALTRVGVTFTQGQKDTIKALVDTGRTADAQRLILKELHRETGGSAAAFGKTLPGQLAILRGTFENVTGDIVGKLVPAFASIVTWANKNGPKIRAALAPVFDAIKEKARIAIAFIREHWPEISAAVKSVAAAVKGAWASVGPTLTKVIKIAARTIIPLIQSIAKVVKGVAELIKGIAHGDWSLAWKGIKDVVGGAIKGIKTVLIGSVKVLAVLAENIGKAIVRGLLHALSGLGQLVAKLILLPINAVINAINAIKLPAISVDTHIPHIGKIHTPALDVIPHIAPLTIPSSPSSIPSARTAAPIHVHTTIELDHRPIARKTTEFQARRNQREPTQTRGRQTR